MRLPRFVSRRKGELLEDPLVAGRVGRGPHHPQSLRHEEQDWPALRSYGEIVEVLKEQKRVRDKQFPECDHVFFWRTEDVMLCTEAGGSTALLTYPGKKYSFAIDLTDDPYYGEKKGDYVVGGKRKASTNRFFSYATCYLIDGKRKFTIGVIP